MQEVVVYSPMQALIVDLLREQVFDIPIGGWLALGLLILCVAVIVSGRRRQRRKQEVRRSWERADF